MSPDERQWIRLTQQARGEDKARVAAACARMSFPVEIAEFFADLPARIAAAHLVIGRAGASTVSELAVIGRPSVLVPFPHALDQDQAANAAALAASRRRGRGAAGRIHARAPGRDPARAPSPRRRSSRRPPPLRRRSALRTPPNGSPTSCSRWRGRRRGRESSNPLMGPKCGKRPDAQASGRDVSLCHSSGSPALRSASYHGCE